MNELQYDRVKFLKEYTKNVLSDYRQGKIDKEEAEQDFDWIEARLTELETEVYGEEKSSPTSPEIASMGEIADDFFEYVGGICSTRSLD